MENMLIAGILSYILGSIPNGLWLGKALWHTDLREHGSHNIGATNAWRTLGKGPGFLIFLLDYALNVDCGNIFILIRLYGFCIIVSVQNNLIAF